MQQTAEKIYEIVKDYRQGDTDCAYPMSVQHIINWANQFGKDALFVLEELLYFLPEVYISKEKARELLRNRLIEIQQFYGYKTMNEMVVHTHFLDVQKPHKSQSEILQIIDDILQSEYMIDYKDCIDKPKTNYIYFDDVLATGGTVYRDIGIWLREKNDGINENYRLVLNKKISLGISFFCYHTLGHSNILWRLANELDSKLEKVILTGVDYIIENKINTKYETEKQKLNFAFPQNNQSTAALNYLANLDVKFPNKNLSAFRPNNLPKQETFFSNSTNRVKLEDIFLEEGIKLLSKVQTQTPDKRKRPLGDTVRSHQTFGTGTLFFTWRNISNTCPLVFWWNVPTHNWIPLFDVKNRGV